MSRGRGDHQRQRNVTQTTRVIKRVEACRNGLAEEHREHGSRDELPRMLPFAIEGERYDGLKDHPAADLRVAPIHVAVREEEVELRAQRPDV
jgi:hypothetical protein